MPTWPKDNQSARNAFYGDPGRGEIASQMVPVIPPFAMYYTDDTGKRKIKAIQFHKKAAPYLLAALNEIWDYCGHDQARIDACGASNYNGAYNHRMVRGSSTKWSNHAYATAIDLDADNNKLGTKGNMPAFIVDAFCRQGAMWGGWYKTRPDWMHFEFVDNGGRKPKSAPPVFAPVAHVFDEPAAPADEFEDAEANEHESEDSPVAPVSTPINVQPPTAQYSLDVEILQRKLVKMNYHEIGDVDGLWGGKTRGAVAAFMNDRGQTTDGNYTPAVTNEINKAVTENWSRPIAPARANATARDLAPKVEAVRQSIWQRFVAKLTGAGAGGVAVVTGVGSQFGAVNDHISPIKQYFATVPGGVWFALIALAAFAVYLSANKSQNATVNDYNTGKIN
jgi:peptidoglycan hydrolase-like protein with peptidoglycan-binding domain